MLHEYSRTRQKQSSYTELSVILNRARRQEGATSYGSEMLFSGSDQEPDGLGEDLLLDSVGQTQWTGLCPGAEEGRGWQEPPAEAMAFYDKQLKAGVLHNSLNAQVHIFPLDEFIFVPLSSDRSLFHCSPVTDDNKIMLSLDNWKLVIMSF